MEYFDRAARREGKNTTVMVDGFAISKESMNCGEWEAVPTFAGKDPRLAEPKRAKKAALESQSICQVCLDGGDLILCGICPRAYHFDCLEPDFKAKAKGWQFNCPQHECHDCSQKTTDAGGMLYRCRWCERAYCEDCLDFEKTELIGNSLIEYDLLGFEEQTQAFYVQCHVCTETHKQHPEDPRGKLWCDRLAEEWQVEHEKRFREIERELSPGAESLTDATSVETPGVITPHIPYDDEIEFLGSNPKKRKSKTDGRIDSPIKRERREV